MELVTGRAGSPHITSQQDRQKHQGIWGTGAYILNTGNNLEAVVQSSNNIQIKDGALMSQGALFSVKVGTVDEVTIANGSQGMMRKDVIVARYTYNQGTNTENAEWAVVQGTPAASNPQIPQITEGDIQAGDATVDTSVFIVTLDGINITSVDVVPELAPDIAELKALIDELNGKMFMCELTEFDTTTGSGTVWRATEAGVTRSLTQPITDFKMIGFMVINGSTSDNITHRQVQWYSAAWLKQIIDEDNASRRRIMFNYTRSETGRRVWVILNSGSYTNITFAKADAGSDTYDLIVWGLK